MKMVYCKHCKYHRGADVLCCGGCNHSSNIRYTDLPTGRSYYYHESVYVKNKNNDCEYYKTKWYLRWFIRGE